jgi:nicotinamide mononucleotide transporter
MSWTYWLVSLLALVGVWLNIKKNVACFWIWAFTNLAWAEADLSHGLPAQALLQFTYFLLSIYGILKWSLSTPGTSKDRKEG